MSTADVTQRILYRPAVLRALRDGDGGDVQYIGPFRGRHGRQGQPRALSNAGPAPRYDDVYWEGVARFDAIARGEIEG